jgi:NAD(P)-dependent dehydrogenase (short-subunit alcohol dehydrogenase family)
MALTDQVVLITGCSSGIGQALASELATRGQHVFASARKLSALAALSGPKLEQVTLDVTDEASIAQAVAQVIERAGRIDILVNNAGFNPFGPLAEIPLADARRLFETNLLGPLALIQAVFPHMAARGKGRIVNVGSVVGVLPTPFAGVYCASKAGVHMMSEVLRMEVLPFGIDVIEVQPGAVRSRIADNAASALERYAEHGSRYRAVYDGIQRRAGASQNKPMASEDFAREVSAAILADKPPRIVRKGRGANLYPALSKLPGEARDRMLMRQFGLLALRDKQRESGPHR